MNPFTLALDLLFPPKCPFCTKLLEDPRALICPECQSTLPWLEGGKAEQKLQFTSLCASPLRYQGAVRESIHRYKFSGKQQYAKPYGVLLAQCALDHLEGRFDLISWVPVSKRRRRERGYDQSLLLARELAARLDWTLTPTLEKVKHNPPQSGIEGEAQRRANVMDVYRVTDAAAVRGKRVLLVDDVVTTGETLSECARTLLMAGTADVVCLTLARAGK